MNKVLIVDDDREIRTAYKLLLSNHTIFEAGNGQEGFQQYQQCHPDIVLMDLQMPQMDGLSASKKILEMDHAAKIIVITGLANINTSEILASGVQTILEKPVWKENLQAAMNAAIL